MHLIGIALLAQLAAPARQVAPVLEFPEPGVDDTASYHGYQTRFLRDAAENTLQVYLDRRDGRVVNLWADAEDESIGFTVRGADGAPAALHWASSGATVARSARTRTVEYALSADTPRIALGLFLLGSMRVERDFQYSNRHLAPFAGTRFTLPELERLVATIEQLPPAERRRALATLGARDVRTLRARLRPTLTVRRGATQWIARVTQPSLDGRDTIALELRADPRRVIATRGGDTLALRARSGSTLSFAVR
ncbi:MAG TPA: hypothetical protein VFN39_08600, partial [Gemmatimonadaceae bacterium]|nr:hypothetical protein [Gemmatimonadaceae bacterium]